DRQSEAVPVDAEGDEVAAAQRGAGREHLLLRHVADAPVAAADRVAEEGRLAGVEALHPEHDLEQARLARPVRAEHGDELPRPDVEVERRPRRAPAEAERPAADAQDGIGHDSAAAIASTFAVIHDT